MTGLEVFVFLVLGAIVGGSIGLFVGCSLNADTILDYEDENNSLITEVSRQNDVIDFYRNITNKDYVTDTKNNNEIDGGNE